MSKTRAVTNGCFEDARCSATSVELRTPVAVTPDRADGSPRPLLPRKPAAATGTAFGPPRAAAADARDSADAGVVSRKPVAVSPDGIDGRPEPSPLRKPTAAATHAAAVDASAAAAATGRRSRRRRGQRGRRRRPPEPTELAAEALVSASATRRDRRRRHQSSPGLIVALATPPNTGAVPHPPKAGTFSDGVPSARGEETLRGGAGSRKTRPGTDTLGFRSPPDPSRPQTRSRPARQRRRPPPGSKKRFRKPTRRSRAWRAAHPPDRVVGIPAPPRKYGREHGGESFPGEVRLPPTDVDVAELVRAYKEADVEDWAACADDNAPPAGPMLPGAGLRWFEDDEEVSFVSDGTEDVTALDTEFPALDVDLGEGDASDDEPSEFAAAGKEFFGDDLVHVSGPEVVEPEFVDLYRGMLLGCAEMAAEAKRDATEYWNEEAERIATAGDAWISSAEDDCRDHAAWFSFYIKKIREENEYWFGEDQPPWDEQPDDAWMASVNVAFDETMRQVASVSDDERDGTSSVHVEDLCRELDAVGLLAEAGNAEEDAASATYAAGGVIGKPDGDEEDYAHGAEDRWRDDEVSVGSDGTMGVDALRRDLLATDDDWRRDDEFAADECDATGDEDACDDYFYRDSCSDSAAGTVSDSYSETASASAERGGAMTKSLPGPNGEAPLLDPYFISHTLWLQDGRWERKQIYFVGSERREHWVEVAAPDERTHQIRGSSAVPLDAEWPLRRKREKQSTAATRPRSTTDERGGAVHRHASVPKEDYAAWLQARLEFIGQRNRAI